MAGLLWTLWPAQSRKVRARSRVRSAEESARAVSAPSVGDRWLRLVGRDGPSGTDLLRVHEPSADRRRSATADALQCHDPDQGNQEGELPSLLPPAYLRRREPTSLPG